MQQLDNLTAPPKISLKIQTKVDAIKLFTSILDAKRVFISKIASTNDERLESFRIRHNVFAEELGLEPINASSLETIQSDDYSILCLLSIRENDKSCGTVRLVAPDNPEQLLPIEEFCANAVTNDTLHPNNFDRSEVCEISRLAVPKTFRRRKFDNYKEAGIGNIDDFSVYARNARSFPLISICLYLSAAAIAVASGRNHAYVMVEPSLARRMSAIGLRFTQIGNLTDYHGQRAPFYIYGGDVQKNLKLPFRLLFSYYLRQYKKHLRDIR